jgi:hypothetical protein|nr:hypothetical protein [Henriciella pelagia]
MDHFCEGRPELFTLQAERVFRDVRQLCQVKREVLARLTVPVLIDGGAQPDRFHLVYNVEAGQHLERGGMESRGAQVFGAVGVRFEQDNLDALAGEPVSCRGANRSGADDDYLGLPDSHDLFSSLFFRRGRIAINQ